MNKTKSNKKPVVVITLVSALALLLAGTFLWFTAKDSVKNIFDMDLFDVVLVEEFDPTIPVVPGVDIDKKVGVQNKGNTDVAVRVKLEKELQLLEFDAITQNPKIDYKTTTDLSANEMMVTMSAEQVAIYTDKAKSGFEEFTVAGTPANVKVYKRTQADPNNSGQTKTEYFAYMTDGSNRVVKYDPQATTDKFTYAYYKQGDYFKGLHECTSTTVGLKDFAHPGITLEMNPQLSTYWELDKENGYYYYKTLLPPGAVTELLLQQVKFADDMENKMKGAIFVVTPTMEAVQGKDAAAAAENWNATIDEGAKTVTVGR